MAGRKKVTVSLTALTIIALLSIISTASSYHQEEVVFNPWSEEVFLGPGQIAVLDWGWTSCSRGLVSDWLRANRAYYTLMHDGEVVQEIKPWLARFFWRRPEIIENPYFPKDLCIWPAADTWITRWVFKHFRIEEPGDYELHIHVELKEPVIDGFDTDQDGQADWYSDVLFDRTIIIHVGGSISGRVETETGEPIAGLWVDACEYDPEEPFCHGAETDEQGYYSIVGLPTGDYRVSIWNQGWVTELYDDTHRYEDAARVPVTAGLDTGGIDFVMQEAGSISGTVTAEGDVPIAGLWVDACEYDPEEPFCESAETDDQGRYIIVGLPSGDYRISIWNQGWVTELYDDAHRFEDAARVTVTAGFDTGGIDFVMQEAGSISGTATAEGDGPITGLWVDACEYDPEEPFCESAETDDQGRYTIVGLPPGDYRVSIWNQGWVTELYDDAHRYEDAARVTVTASLDTGDIDFAMEQGGSISGTIYEQGGGPIEGLDVVALDFETDEFFGSAQSNADGSYAILGLPTGSYRVFVYQQGDWMEEFYQEALRWEGATPVQAVSGQETPNIHFTLELGGSISGTVIEQGGGPLEGLDVVACQYSDDEMCWGATTEANGSYRIGGLPQEQYHVFVYQQGNWMEEFYEEKRTRDEATPVSVAAGVETSGIQFTLEMGGSISGTVVEVGNGLLAGVFVSACDYETDTFCIGAETDASGAYAITGVPAGTYRVSVRGQPDWIDEYWRDTQIYEKAESVSVIPPGEVSGIDFSLTQAGSISGTVLQESGAPLSGIFVSACDFATDSFCLGAESDGGGNYWITGLPTGTYRVSVRGQPGWLDEFYFNTPDFGLAEPVPVTPPNDTTGINFSLAEAGAVSGNVVAEIGGAPLANIWVSACEYGVQDDPFCVGEWTDGDGNYIIWGLSAGDYRVNTYHLDWLDEFYEEKSTFEDADKVTVTVGVKGGINFTLLPAGSISGTVVEDGGSEIIGIWVRACDYETGTFCLGAETGSDGVYAITNLPVGDYRVFAEGQPNWIDEYYGDTTDYGQAKKVPVVAHADTGGIDFALVPSP